MPVNIMGFKAELEAIRIQIAAVSEVIDGLSNPFPPAVIVKSRVEAEVEAIRAHALDRINLGCTGAAESNFRPGMVGQLLSKLTAVELFALVEPGKLTKVLNEAGESEASQANPAFRLTVPDAEKTLAAKEAELFALSVREEALVRQAEEAGLSGQRRRDALPAVVLAPDGELQPFLDKQAA